MKYFNEIHSQTKKTAKTKIADHTLGLSFAIGTFVSILPTPGLSIIVGLALAFAFRLPKIAMILSFIIWNPFVTALLAFPSITLGRLLLKPALVELTGLAQILHTTKEYLVGNFFIALYIAVLSYFIIRLIVKIVRLPKTTKN